MDVRRVMEVWDPAGRIAGTGYLIADRLVLTALHNIQSSATTSEQAVEVRRLALYRQPPTAWVAAEVLWPEQPPDIEQDPHADAALLLISAPSWQPPDTAAPVRWGRLPEPSPNISDTKVACAAVGFPEAEQRDGERDTKQISGHIEILSGLKSGLITAHIDRVATPGTTDGSSSWSGASGAALFCGSLLTGILTTDRTSCYDGNQLIAVPLATLAARHGFTRAIKTAGNSLVLEDIDSLPGEPNERSYSPGSRASDETLGIVRISLSHIPGQIFFNAVRPRVIIDGKVHEVRWGSHDFTLAVGLHEIKIFVPYINNPECCPASTTAKIDTLNITLIEYKTPLSMFQNGKIRTTRVFK
ncbi:trypsin-like serine protease [Streptomyces antibioticus]|uniref:trypsin-like serine protease n=1 Tax=Streptomyces antibioticus TaxID=1890 RepID=UPI0036A7EF0A